MSDPPSRLAAFISELRHRRVFRVAIVYAGVAFIVFQVADFTFPALHVPDWFSSAVVVLLALGFPIAVGLAWAFDLTAEGLVRAKPKREPTAAKAPHHIVIGNKSLAVIAVLAVIVAVWALLREPSPGGAPITSIAVLPLDNMSGDPEQEYFTEGMHEAIITNLNRLSALKVISRTSAMRYKDTDKLMPEIARELNVDALVEGSVLKAGNRVRITAQLIHGASDEHLWSNDYEGDLTDILVLQKTIARAIAGEIGLALKTEEKARLEAIPSEVNPEAYDHYLKGWRYREEENPVSIQKAMEHLEQAVALDPGFALAWANLGIAYGLALDIGLIEQTEAIAKARYAVEQALDLDPDLAQAHVNLGLLIYYIGMNSVTTAARWDEAGAAFQRGVELNPGLLDAHYEYGLFLSRSARYDEAIPHFLKAQELSPLSHHAYQGLGRTYFSMGQFEKAYDYFRKAQDLEPSNSFIGYWLEISRLNMLHQQGHYEELLAEGQASGDGVTMMGAFRGLNEHVPAAALFDSLRAGYQQRGASKRTLVVLHAVFGDREGALTLLEEHFAELSLGQKRWYMANYHSGFGDLHGDPRYQALMAQTGLQY